MSKADESISMPQHPHLCDVCGHIFDDHSLKWHTRESESNIEDFYYLAPQPWHKTLSSLRRSQTTGCFICKETLDKDVSVFFRSEYNFETSRDFASALPKASASHGRPMLCLSLRVYDDAGYVEASYDFDIYESFRLQQLAVSSVDTKTCRDSGDESIARLAKRWLWECVQTHTKCNTGDGAGSYPTRLLSLSGGHLRLVDASRELPFSPKEQYATLSHCWGKSAALSKGLDDAIYFLDDETERRLLRDGINVSSLPQTFRDAIVTVERLGLSLLWIDCYCIKQRGHGSDSDKKRELVNMENVYGNAVVNIGATVAGSPLDGCFRQRDLSAFEPLEVWWKPTALHERSYYSLCAPREMSHTEFYHQPLMLRGWVLQERMLSRRMIHFTDHQIHWECGTIHAANELWPYGVPDSEAWYRNYPFSIKLGLGHHEVLSIALLSDEWWKIVRMYSQMVVSRPQEDKFIALGGIAKRFASMSGADYIAGMWQQAFPLHLLWRPIDKDARRNVTHPRWRAPSCSWASMDGCIVHLVYWQSADIYRAEASVVKVRVELVHQDNPYGALKSAQLTLRGRLLSTTASVRGPEPPLFYARTFANDDVQFQLDDRNTWTERLGLFILATNWNRDRLDFIVCVEGLALAKLAQGVYERVGIFTDLGGRLYASAMAQEEVELTIV